MPAAYDFSDGIFSGNIVNALSKCEIFDIVTLKKEGLLYFSRINSILKYKSLFYKGIDAYADVTGCSIASFLFGSEAAPLPCYTSWDQYVIRALDSLTKSQCKSLRTAIQRLYWCPIMGTSVDVTPSKRYMAVLEMRFGKSIPDEIPESDNRKYRLDVCQEIRRFKYASHHSPNFLFHSDYWPDLAMFTGVSVRWLLGIRRHPLYCKTAYAEDLFDLYTLMHPYYRKSFIRLLLHFSNEYIPELEEFYYEGEGSL